MKATAISLDAFRLPHADEPLAARRLTLASSNRAPARPETPARLTPRQLEVLALLSEGLPNKLICRRLEISPGTVKAHISSILRELGVASRLQAVVVARRRGLVVELEPHQRTERLPAAPLTGSLWTAPGA